MKLIVILMTTCLLQVSAIGFAQKISFTEKSTTLGQVFNEITKQTGYEILFSNQRIDLKSKLSVNFKNTELKKVLEVCLHHTALSYFIEDNTIIIQRSSKTLIGKVISAFIVIDITGKVVDKEGKGMPGASVKVKGESKAVSTDVNGSFSLKNLEPNAILIISYTGFNTQEVAINGQKYLSVLLTEDIGELEQVVVIGYGSQKKSDLTGAVASVSGKSLTVYPTTNAVQALQGRAAGVAIQSVNGEPGGGFKIRVRGASSINANSNPLFVVDGIVDGVLPSSENIASVEVLKDASSSAIYGSRAANGVVIITTKSGTIGKTEVLFNNSFSAQKELGRLSVLNASDFVSYINETRGANFYDPTQIEHDTNWQDLVYQNGYNTNNQLAVSGGSEQIKYYVSGVLFDQKGIIRSSEFNRISLNSKLNFKLSERINLDFSTLIGREKQNGVYSQRVGGANDGGVVISSLRIDPNLGVTDNNGVYTTSRVGKAPYENPRAVIDGRSIENIQENIQVNFLGSYKISDALKFNSTLGLGFRNFRNGQYNNKISNEGLSTNGSGTLTNIRRSNFISENYFSYKKLFKEKHDLGFSGGYSYQKFSNERFSASNQGFITDAFTFWNLGAGSNFQPAVSGTDQSEISSFYGRINYKFDDRYLFTVTSRYDGASQFSEGNKWSFFPSAAFAWNLANEKFFPKNDFTSSLKLRTSYGVTGNQAIGPYESLARVSPVLFAVGGTVVNAVRPTSIANKDLTWETTKQFNIGADLELFKGRISLTGDFYIKRTNDLLFTVDIPSFSGYTSRLENLGKVENRGVEFMINSKNISNDFSWSTNLNVTINRNKVLQLPEGLDRELSSGPSVVEAGVTSILRVGAPVGSFFGYTYEGVYQAGDTFIPGVGFENFAGGEKFRDMNKDGILNAADRSIIGNPNEDFSFGLTNDFSYKNFDLNIFFQGSVGADIYNFTRMELDLLRGITNATQDALNRWTPQNTATSVPKAYLGRNSRSSTRFIEDGSYLRLKNLSLGYNLNPNVLTKLKIRSLRVSLSAQNLLTITRYTGVDPEVAFRGADNINLGGDYDSYPNVKSFTMGLNIGF